ncbi:hypothetical protein RDWZM_000874 [Blomia tropicalis]|uniref:Nodal modulator 1 n=1 Tax=Blomia tropicalis TaxID=40697 RepID=A0A9Q0MB13_BLOTA|nr:hypothetical protein RDWZM_000874 [Blomia tropicalis]
MFWCIIIGVCLVSSSKSNDVIGCGGFVESNVNINYSPIQVKLYTNRGVLKYTSDCAPNNGYYFIPLYDHGEYSLRIEPPNGWSFDPMQVEFNFDGQNDICSKQTDINFKFKGFSVHGKITSIGSENGPLDVKVVMQSKLDSNFVKQIATGNNGEFVFQDVLPGKYIVKTLHPELEFEQNQIEIEVVNDNVQLKDQFRVVGYTVKGRVLSDGQPIKGVQFALYTKETEVKINCDDGGIKPKFLAKLAKINSFYSKYVCNALSNSDGIFHFKTLPVGDYILYTYYQVENIRFEVSPYEFEFSVKHENQFLDQLFQIGGFTISGSVTNKFNPKNEPIQNVHLTLVDQNGKNDPIVVQSISSETGSFTIDNVKTSTYIARTNAPHYQFEDLVIPISPNSPNLPTIYPSKFEICGQIHFYGSMYDQIELLIMKKDSIFERILIENGKFCYFLPGGEYQLRFDNKKTELRFVPNMVDLKLVKPELELKFEQFTATLSGIVELNPSTILSGENDQLVVNVAQSKSLLKTSKLKVISSNRYQFKFENLLPGEYVVSIDGKLSKFFCWNIEETKVRIEESNIDSVVFKQKGFILQIVLSHSTNLMIENPKGKVITINQDTLTPDRVIRQCVEESGRYQIKPQGCHVFSESETIFDTNTMFGQTITLTAIRHRITAHIRSSSNLTDLSVNIVVRSLVDHQQSIRTIALTQPILLNPDSDQSPLYQYTIIFDERPMVDIRLEPLSSQLLFKPSIYEFKLEDDCLFDAITFHGRFGIFIDGLVTPGIPNVSISVYDIDSNELVYETVTDSNGKFSGGPFDDDMRLRIEAFKNGYVMKPIPGKFDHFEAHKLASIMVSVVDQSNSKPLTDVLISISGGENNFRKNSVIGSNGKLNFENLHPGKYFIRFVRKEYEFQPQSEMIELKSGSTHRIHVIGTKVAFSCLGTVDSLNREPEAGVVVEAIGLRKVVDDSNIDCTQVQEQAVSEVDGSYRIMGLRPECQYAIRLKIDEHSVQIRESIPRLHSVRVKDADLNDLRFIVLYKQQQLDLSLNVKTNPEYVSSLTVQLYRNDDSQSRTEIFKQKLTSNPFVFLPSIPYDFTSYTIRIDSDLSQTNYRFVPIVYNFIANETDSHLQFEFKPYAKYSPGSMPSSSIDAETAANQLYSIPLLLLIAIIFYYRQIMEFMRNIAQHRDQWPFFNGRTTNGSSSSSSSINEGKKQMKNKTKKVN